MKAPSRTNRLRYCLLGGTFDPVHGGHLAVARAAGEQLNPDLIFWIPALHPVHREPPLASFGHRLAMLRRACAGESRWRVLDIEASLPRPSLSITTIRAMKTWFTTEAEWFFLMGQDNWEGIRAFRGWREIMAETTPVFYPRKNAPVPPRASGAVALGGGNFDISSSSIRSQIATVGLPGVNGIPAAVRQYILDHNLYGPL